MEEIKNYCKDCINSNINDCEIHTCVDGSIKCPYKKSSIKDYMIADLKTRPGTKTNKTILERIIINGR